MMSFITPVATGVRSENRPEDAAISGRFRTPVITITISIAIPYFSYTISCSYLSSGRKENSTFDPSSGGIGSKLNTAKAQLK